MVCRTKFNRQYDIMQLLFDGHIVANFCDKSPYTFLCVCFIYPVYKHIAHDHVTVEGGGASE